MKILLDTHTFLWFIAGEDRLTDFARRLIEDTNNERYLSVASVWEIAIKASLGRLVVPTPPSDLVRDHVWGNAIELLAITPEHFDALYTLPYHHKDPFDRMLIAQAITDELVLLSEDQAFSEYGIQIAWSH